MPKLKSDSKNRYTAFPQTLIWTENFDFTFPVSMDAYVDRIKILMRGDLNLSLSHSDKMRLQILRGVSRSPSLYLEASIQEINESSVKVVGRTGISKNEFIWHFGIMFLVVLIIIFPVGFGTSLGIGWSTIMGIVLYPLMIISSELGVRWARSGLMDDIRRAGMAER